MTKLEDTLAMLTEGHKLDPITDNERVKTQGCKLRSGEESLFVTVLCCEIQRRLEQHALSLPIHEFFYCPSRRTEWKLGFDLSIGRGDPPRRIRTMQKLLTGKLCDRKWTWSCTDEDALHMALLMGDHRAYPGCLMPFLFIHICFCVHDYRRMGETVPKKYLVPGFDSPFRTIIVDLAALCDELDQLKHIDWQKLLKTIRTCDEKEQALAAFGDFDVDRLKIVRAKPFPDLAKPLPDVQATLDEFCPSLYCPPKTAIDDARRFFLTFGQFMERVIDVARQH